MGSNLGKGSVGKNVKWGTSSLKTVQKKKSGNRKVVFCAERGNRGWEKRGLKTEARKIKGKKG